MTLVDTCSVKSIESGMYFTTKQEKNHDYCTFLNQCTEHKL